MNRDIYVFRYRVTGIQGFMDTRDTGIQVVSGYLERFEANN